MANSIQARKRVRQNNKHRIRNKSRMSEIRTYIKGFLKNIVNNKDYNLIFEKYKLLVSKIDKGARDNIIHKNKASRLKKRLNLKFKNCI